MFRSVPFLVPLHFTEFRFRIVVHLKVFFKLPKRGVFGVYTRLGPDIQGVEGVLYRERVWVEDMRGVLHLRL
jgi:hypothetical protein